MLPRAAMYARMSTGLQHYSIDHQMAIMTAYADREEAELLERWTGRFR